MVFKQYINYFRLFQGLYSTRELIEYMGTTSLFVKTNSIWWIDTVAKSAK